MEDVRTYHNQLHNNQFENGVLTYVNEAAYGDLKDLLKDIGIRRETIRFSNIADLVAEKDSGVFESDKSIEYLKNARFTMLDMTDYEYDFPSANEVGHELPISNFSLLEPHMEEMWPFATNLIEVNPIEELKKNSTSRAHRDNQETRAAAKEDDDDDDEEEEEEEEDEEGEGDEDGDEDEGEGDEEEGDEEEEEEEEEPVPDDIIPHTPMEDRFFSSNSNMRKLYNDVELDSFMKLLNVKPLVQWEETNTHHYKVGTHLYEDESAYLDPYFHLLAEVERKHLEKQQAYQFRAGTEVKFVTDPKKKPIFGDN